MICMFRFRKIERIIEEDASVYTCTMKESLSDVDAFRFNIIDFDTMSLIFIDVSKESIAELSDREAAYFVLAAFCLHRL